MTAIQRSRPPRAALALAAALAAGAAQAQEFQPYPQPKVTPEEYAAYAEQVRQSFGFTADIVREDNVIVFSDERTRTFWVFTTKDNPAHPAWVTRQMVEENGQVRVRQVGYYAGSEAAFAKLHGALPLGASAKTPKATVSLRLRKIRVEAYRPLTLTVCEQRFAVESGELIFSPGQYMIFHVPGIDKVRSAVVLDRIASVRYDTFRDLCPGCVGRLLLEFHPSAPSRGSHSGRRPLR